MKVPPSEEGRGTPVGDLSVVPYEDPETNRHGPVSLGFRRVPRIDPQKE